MGGEGKRREPRTRLSPSRERIRTAPGARRRAQRLLAALLRAVFLLAALRAPPLRAVVLLDALRAVLFFVTNFRAVVRLPVLAPFFAAPFLAVLFFAAAFFAGAFFAGAFLACDFLAGAFFAGAFFA